VTYINSTARQPGGMSVMVWPLNPLTCLNSKIPLPFVLSSEY
jgi:hypothetical protein